MLGDPRFDGGIGCIERIAVVSIGQTCGFLAIREGDFSAQALRSAVFLFLLILLHFTV